jgi:hypothetical protein
MKNKASTTAHFPSMINATCVLDFKILCVTRYLVAVAENMMSVVEMITSVERIKVSTTATIRCLNGDRVSVAWYELLKPRIIVIKPFVVKYNAVRNPIESKPLCWILTISVIVDLAVANAVEGNTPSIILNNSF